MLGRYIGLARAILIEIKKQQLLLRRYVFFFFMNKKGVEGLPLKYIIIAIVATIVVGVILQVVDITGTSVLENAQALNRTLTNATSGL